MELTAAMPAAPALPRKNEVGSDQKSGAHVRTLAAARERNVIATAVLLAVRGRDHEADGSQHDGIPLCSCLHREPNRQWVHWWKRGCTYV
jgi:hypothetical protein